MSENKNPKTNDGTSNPAEEAKNEAQELIDSLKLDAQVPSSEEVSDLSDVIGNLQLDLPTEEKSSEQDINLDLTLEAPQSTEQSDNNFNIDEAILSPQQEKTEEINIDLSLSDTESTWETQPDDSQDLQLTDNLSTNSVNEPEEIQAPTEEEEKTTTQPLSQDDKQIAIASEPQNQEQDPQQSSETQQDSPQPIISENTHSEKKFDNSKQENTSKEPTQLSQEEKSQPDPFEKEEAAPQNTEQETPAVQEVAPTSLEAQQQLNSLESLVEDTTPDQESLSLEEEIPTSLEEAYESEETTPPKSKKRLPKGILIGIWWMIVLIWGVVVFMASMPDVVANLLNPQKDTVSIATDPQNTHPLQAQTGEIDQNNIEENQLQQQSEETTEPTEQQPQQESESTNLTAEDLQLRLSDIQQLMDEVEFPSTKDKIRAKVLQKKISALIDQGDLQKADYLLNQLEELIYGSN